MKKIDDEKSLILGIKENDTEGLRLGIHGYFSCYRNFKTYVEGNLDGFTRTDFMSIQEHSEGHFESQWYDYFIPVDRVVFVEEEKKLRPYNTISEFPFKIGETITYKSKQTNFKIKAMVVGAIEYIESQFLEKDLLSIQFSNKSYSPDELFKYFKYLDPQTNEWLPFGIEE